MDTIENRLYRYRAKRVRFLVNGDKFFTGINYALNTEKTRSFDTLLNELTQTLMDHIKLCKGVRYIFAQDGSLVSSLGDFQDGKTYICSSTDTFIAIDYKDKDGVLNWLVRNSAYISSTSGNVRSVIRRQQQNSNTSNNHHDASHIGSVNNITAGSHGAKLPSTPTTAGKLRTSHNNISNNSQQSSGSSSSNNNNYDHTNNETTDHTTTSTPKNHNNNNNNGTKPNSAASTITSRTKQQIQTSRASASGETNHSHNNTDARKSNKPLQVKPICPSTPVNNCSESARKRIGAGSHSPQPRPKFVGNGRQQPAHQQTPTTPTRTVQTKPKQTPTTRQSQTPKSVAATNTTTKATASPTTKLPDTPKTEPLALTNPEMTTDSSNELFGSEVTEKYDIGRPIGDGHFSVVYFCMNKTTQEFCALKLIDKLKCKGRDDMIYNEVAILKRLQHPNIVKLIEEFDYPKQLYLILELVQDGDLFDAISTVTRFSEVHVATMIHNLSSALNYLHKQGIVHRDIKPENLLISVQDDGSQSLKLADFGLAIEVGDTPLYSVCGTAFYVSPEMLNEAGYDYKVDVWSTGVICFILLCGYPPFTSENESNQDELFDAILAGDLQFAPPYWNKISQHAKNLIKCMLTVDPEQRYTAEQVFRHPWTMGTSSNFDGIEPMNISRKISLQYGS